MEPEPWLRGPIPGVAPELMPVAHALIHAREELERALGNVSLSEAWVTPGGAASVGYHARHLAGSVDRLLTYAAGETLSGEQQAALREEKEPGDPPMGPDELLELVTDAIDRALQTVGSTSADQLGWERRVGRAQLPSTVGGLLFHIAEHTQRHVGQIITTAKIVRGLNMGKIGA